MESDYRNLFCWTKACRERKQQEMELEMTELELERQKLSIMSDIANQPAREPSKALIIIPVLILGFGALTAFILIRKKRK